VAIGDRSEQPGEIGRGADAHERHAVVTRGREQLPQKRDRVVGVVVRGQVVRKGGPLDEGEIAAVPVLGRRVAGDPDGKIRPSIERVDRIDEGRRLRVVLRDRHAQERAGTPVGERVAHGEGEDVVHVAGHVGVEDDPWRCGRGHHGRCGKAEGGWPEGGEAANARSRRSIGHGGAGLRRRCRENVLEAHRLAGPCRAR